MLSGLIVAGVGVWLLVTALRRRDPARPATGAAPLAAPSERRCSPRARCPRRAGSRRDGGHSQRGHAHGGPRRTTSTPTGTVLLTTDPHRHPTGAHHDHGLSSPAPPTTTPSRVRPQRAHRPRGRRRSGAQPVGAAGAAGRGRAGPHRLRHRAGARLRRRHGPGVHRGRPAARPAARSARAAHRDRSAHRPAVAVLPMLTACLVLVVGVGLVAAGPGGSV